MNIDFARLGCSKSPPREQSAPFISWLARSGPTISRRVPAVAMACFLGWCFVSLRSDFSWDDAEPEILNQSWRLANGRSIYHGIESPPYAFAAYPPIYFAITAALMKFSGLSYLPAKLLSFLAALSIGWAMIRLNREWNKAGRDGLWAAFLLFLIPAFLYNSTRCHVQMTAVALSVWSLYFFLRNRWKETLIVSPLIAVLAVYTKQTQIALPLAMALYLAIRNRRWFLPYVSIVLLLGAIPFAWLQKISGGFFFFNIVELAKLEYSAWNIPPVFLHHAGPALIFLGIAASILWRRFKDGAWEAIDCYWGFLFVLTLISLGRLGSHGQYVVELIVVTLLYLLRTAGLPRIPHRDALVAAQILLLFLYAPAFIFLEEGYWDVSANRASSRIYSLIGERSGPVLAQQGSFSLFSRGEIYIQLFHFSALSRAGMWDPAPLLSTIEKKEFCCVVTEFPIDKPVLSKTDSERFTPETISAVRRNYRFLESVHPYYFYVPSSAK